MKRFHFKNFVGATKQGVRAELLEGLAQVPVVGPTSSVVGQHVRQLFSNYLFFHKSGVCCAIGRVGLPLKVHFKNYKN